MKIIIVMIYLLVLIIAYAVVGWWALIGLIPLVIYFLSSNMLLFYFKDHDCEKFSSFKDEIIKIAEQKEITKETQLEAEKLAILMGIRVDKNNGKLPKMLFSQMSGKYLGYFLAHLLKPEYSEKILKDVAVSMKKNKSRDYAVDVIRSFKALNGQAARRLDQYIELGESLNASFD
jgi:hypothetical protein